MRKTSISFSNIETIIITIFVFLLLFEGVLSITNLNANLLKSVIYTQNGLPEIHISSNDSFRLYELKPDSFTTCANRTDYVCIHPLEDKYNYTNFSVNRYGFRGK